jgi:hypothetical protein
MLAVQRAQRYVSAVVRVFATRAWLHRHLSVVPLPPNAHVAEVNAASPHCDAAPPFTAPLSSITASKGSMPGLAPYAFRPATVTLISPGDFLDSSRMPS